MSAVKPPSTPREATRPKPASSDKKDRLSNALRNNLKRRKAGAAKTKPKSTGAEG